MALSYDWLNLEEDEPISFVLYGSYEEQMQYLTDEQLGRLIRNAMHYVKTGEQKPEEPIVDMMLSVMANDIRNQKRNQKKRSDAGKAGGEASADAKKEAKKAAKKTEKKQNKKTNPASGEESFNDSERFATTCKQYVDKDVDGDEDVDVEMDADVENDINQHYYYCSSKGAGAEAVEDAVEDYIPYGREQHLTTPAELQKMHALADELMQSYRSKKASPDDCEKVFGYVHTIGVTANGDHYGIYSQEKADLLRHAFEQASLRSDISWQYINRIYLNYDKNNVTNVDEAIAYEKAWDRGEVTT